MTYIHEKSDWPAFKWDGEKLSLKLSALRYRQGQLLGRMQGLGFDLRAEANLETITNDVVKSSAIEGETLNREEVRSSIARRLGIETAGLKPGGRDVEGIVEMMLDATQKHDQELSDERLFSWQAALFPTGRSGLRKIVVGAWRTEEAGPMQVVSGPIGKEKVHFEAPEASHIEDEMTGFLEWFNRDERQDPIIKAGIAHLWFVTVHPFEDGNGRIARAIADMSLARADGSKERFYSMSLQIERERNAYYDYLQQQQRSDLDITRWLAWFLDCLDRAIESAEETLASVLYKAKVWELVNRKPVNERQQKIINLMLGDFEGYLNTSKYAKLAKCSTDTALRDIRELLEREILIQNPGGGRSTSYRLATMRESSKKTRDQST
ncbi:MAG: Fic family protein [Gammaproteobacteria bacterium]|jgi:Fic family protein